ncbi:MAG: glycine--tRNA ligase [Patescibacteria group bacterium]|nr:glycine--tRNA ligase [Patescibacteria group bacterium]
MKDLMQKIVSFSKRRGFIFPSSEIYGGAAGLWDYGPLGALLKNNLKNLWLDTFVFQEQDIFLIEGTILMNSKVWQASGHIDNFTDALKECKKCNLRFRADHLEAGKFVGQGKAKEKNQCSGCGSKDFTEPKMFNLMFKTFLGPIEDKMHQTYLRPETAQSMFTNFQNVSDSMRAKIPFGIAQLGKSFRNEITLSDFTFRSREFDIAEIEFFIKKEDDEKWFDYWIDKLEKFYLDLGLDKKNLRRFEHPKDSLAHYSKRTVDIEYKFPFGWSELGGVANRMDYDLKKHEEFSKKNLKYFDSVKNENYYPYVIEPTMGIDRALLALLVNGYQEVENGRTQTTKSVKDKEIFLKIHKKIAPIKIAVLPLVKNKPELTKKAKQVYKMLKTHFVCQYDESGSIGRRYRRQDEIGTPFALTIDFESLENEDATIRDRDTMKQERIKIKDIIQFLTEKL